MKFWLLFLVAYLSIGCLIFYTKIYINIKYKRSNEDDYISLNIYMFKKLVTYSMEIPIIDIVSRDDFLGFESTISTIQDEDKSDTRNNSYKDTKSSKNIRRIRFFIRKIVSFTRVYCQIIDKILKSLICEKLYWRTVFGSEDAAITGIITGLLWTMKALVLKKLEGRIFYIGHPVISVNPMFGRSRFDVDFQCIFSIRLGNVIKAFRNIYDIKK